MDFKGLGMMDHTKSHAITRYITRGDVRVCDVMIPKDHITFITR